MPSHDDERMHTHDFASNQKLRHKGDLEATKLGIEQNATNNDISHRKVHPGYKDNSLNASNDVSVTLHPRAQMMSENMSRNEIGPTLHKSSSTKERLLEQNNNSVPSGSQFTLTNNQKIRSKYDTAEKPLRMSKQLFEEYKHPDMIEEEKKEYPNEHSFRAQVLSDEEEEEKVPVRKIGK